MNLLMEQTDSQTQKQTCGCPRGGKSRQTGILGLADATFIYRMVINNKVLLHTTGNYVQYLMINHMEKNVEKNACICITESLCCLVEMNTTLEITHTSIKQIFKKRNQQIKYLWQSFLQRLISLALMFSFIKLVAPLLSAIPWLE